VVSAIASVSVSRIALWSGRVLSALSALFLLFDGVMKLVKPGFVVEATVRLGYPESVIIPLGVILVASTVLYLIPRTSILGAILLTGYLGGAVATHVRHEDTAFEIVFPAIFGALVWGGLVLRDTRLRSLVPWRSSRADQPFLNHARYFDESHGTGQSQQGIRGGRDAESAAPGEHDQVQRGVG
jgi:hypothetical protein